MSLPYSTDVKEIVITTDPLDYFNHDMDRAEDEYLKFMQKEDPEEVEEYRDDDPLINREIVMNFFYEDNEGRLSPEDEAYLIDAIEKISTQNSDYGDDSIFVVQVEGNSSKQNHREYDSLLQFYSLIDHRYINDDVLFVRVYISTDNILTIEIEYMNEDVEYFFVFKDPSRKLLDLRGLTFEKPNA